ncbi:LysM peptidoglycan-binding domain-containing protein [Paenibacillus thermotolerans]|uniref:LysM peptidoglycan-binding domain-containing protein n=1 Tax=Paenibacillus thermotolerans TaxID=3027807 RepID=UPI0023683778|nr:MULTISPECIES: LysM peptidoglycan-binding domain-containing protein [unclassified Paenibacillus]
MRTHRSTNIYIRRKLLNRMCALLFIIIVSASSGAMLQANANERADGQPEVSYVAEDHKEYKKLCVESGDTLWSIAKKYGDPDCDIRAYVHDLKELNQLESSNLQVGQIILLP